MIAIGIAEIGRLIDRLVIAGRGDLPSLTRILVTRKTPDPP